MHSSESVLSVIVRVGFMHSSESVLSVIDRVENSDSFY